MRIGIDLGGTNIAGGLVGDDGKLINKKTTPTLPLRGVDAVVGDIIGLCKALVEFSPYPVQYVGIGCPGVVHPPSQTLVNAPNLGFFNVPLSKMVEDVLRLPVFLENDANCAALGEMFFGAAKGVQNAVVITIGTGIGGGIIIDGKLYTGTFFGAGEVGHQIIEVNGRACGCGKNGCWEAYASAAALMRDGASLGLGQLTAKDVFDAAHAGDDGAKVIIENYYNYLCIGLLNIINILQPEIVVIGGGISGQGDSLLSAIQNRINLATTRFAIARLGNDAGIVGWGQAPTLVRKTYSRTAVTR
ncbi:MAG: ROK family protein [Defluviitaleaceae bacterium]|nr:ROK family protein [Defluviitaleaceae bacterium]